MNTGMDENVPLPSNRKRSVFRVLGLIIVTITLFSAVIVGAIHAYDYLSNGKDAGITRLQLDTRETFGGVSDSTTQGDSFDDAAKQSDSFNTDALSSNTGVSDGTSFNGFTKPVESFDNAAKQSDSFNTDAWSSNTGVSDGASFNAFTKPVESSGFGGSGGEQGPQTYMDVTVGGSTSSMGDAGCVFEDSIAGKYSSGTSLSQLSDVTSESDCMQECCDYGDACVAIVYHHTTGVKTIGTCVLTSDTREGRWSASTTSVVSDRLGFLTSGWGCSGNVNTATTTDAIYITEIGCYYWCTTQALASQTNNDFCCINVQLGECKYKEDSYMTESWATKYSYDSRLECSDFFTQYKSCCYDADCGGQTFPAVVEITGADDTCSCETACKSQYDTIRATKNDARLCCDFDTSTSTCYYIDNSDLWPMDPSLYEDTGWDVRWGRKFSCVGVEDNCTNDSDCCDGFCEGDCCQGVDESCSSNSECCTNDCSSGSCTCIASGSACSRAEDCCDGDDCVGDTCCSGLGSSCGSASECCSGHCNSGTCCLNDGQTSNYNCGSDSHCCGSAYCLNGGSCNDVTCVGIVCSNSDICCLDYYCFDDTLCMPSV